MTKENKHEKDVLAMAVAMKDLRENFIPMLFDFYEGCIAGGFDRDQAFRLTRDYLITLFSRKGGDQKDGY